MNICLGLDYRRCPLINADAPECSTAVLRSTSTCRIVSCLNLVVKSSGFFRKVSTSRHV